MNKQPNPLQLLAALLIDYFRWTQLTPMILMWAILLGMLFFLFFATHEEATVSAGAALLEWITTLPWIGPKFVAWMETRVEDGVVDLSPGPIDFKSAVLWTWGIISLVFMALSWVAGLFLGPFKPWTLKRKLGFAGLASLFFVFALLGLYALDIDSWNDGLGKVILSSSGMALVIFIVSAWCLSISHALGLLSDYVADAEFVQKDKPEGLL